MAQGFDFNAMQARITDRTWKDPAFAREFFADPKATIEKYAEQKLPPDVTVFAHKLTPTELHLVIPDKPTRESSELSDADLEKVAGGEVVIMTVSMVISAVTAYGISQANDSTQRRHGW